MTKLTMPSAQQTSDAYKESDTALDYDVWLKVWNQALLFFQLQTTPRIVGVAIQVDGGRVYKLPCPNRHHNIFPIMDDPDLDGDCVQGFYDEDGNFLDRVQAMARAQFTKQLKRDPDPKKYQGPELFSEDLW
jgi:hypothetical protein